MHTTEQLNAALAGRYVVDRLVGEGGMATVYLARDVKHDRQVALKVLKPELGAVLGVERFLAEIKVTANLQHPNLLPLFDSAAGTLVYQSATAESQVGWVGQTGLFTPITPMLDEPRPYVYPRLSPDGTRVALTIGTGGRSDVWVHDLTSGTPTRLTTEGTVSERPEWSHDGKRVVYRTDRGNRSAIWWQPADMSGPATPIIASDRHDYYEGVMTPDGKSIVFQVDDAVSSQADVFWRAIEGDTVPKSISTTNFVEAQARISPDGKWVAYVTDASGTSQVIVQPFPGPGGQVQVSVAGGTEPVWARDGKKLYYRDGRRLIAASVATAPGFSVTSRAPLFADTFLFGPSPHANYDVSLDGSKFLMIKNSEAPKLLVVHGWFTELKARLAGRR